MPLEIVSTTPGVIPTAQLTAPIITSNALKIWNREDKKIAVVEKNNTIHFSIIEQGGERAINARDVIGIPLGISIAGLKAFLSDTWVRLAPLGQNEYKLYIQPCLKGGGNILTDRSKLWLDGIVPYEIDIREHPYESHARKVILQAIQAWQNTESMLKFVPRTDQHDVLVFGDDLKVSGAHIGRQGGAQYIRCRLENGEFSQVSIMNEIGRAIGFYNEHMRPDRNKYVTISEKADPAEYGISDEGSMMCGRYDFASIMHYPIDKLLRHDQWIMSKIEFPKMEKIGVTALLSIGDIATAKYLYPVAENIINMLPSAEGPFSAPEPTYIAPVIQISLVSAAAAAAAATPPIPDEIEDDVDYGLGSEASVSDIGLGSEAGFSIASSPAFSRTPEWETILNVGNKAYSVKHYKTAYDYYRTLIKEYGQFMTLVLPILQYRCGQCQYRTGEYASAISWYKLALQADPKNAVLHHECGLCYQRLADYKAADIYFAQALVLAPANEEIKTVYKKNRKNVQKKGSIGNMLSASSKVFKKSN